MAGPGRQAVRLRTKLTPHLRASASLRLMRIAILLSVAAAFAGAALAQAPSTASVATLDQGVARPGGTYISLPLATATACADACAADGLCMSWTFVSAAPARCDLKAVIPHPVRDPSAASGLAARAPSFARLVAPSQIGPPRDLAAAAPAHEPPAAAAAVQTSIAAEEIPADALDTPAATRDAPALPPPPAVDAPILLSADSAPLPLRDR